MQEEWPGVNNKVTPIIFIGGGAASPIEQVVENCQQAVVLDTLVRLLKIDLFDTPIVASASKSFAEELRHWPVIVEPDPAEFHFGSRLRDLVLQYRIERPLYIGGGSTPLLSESDLERIGCLLCDLDRSLVANNFFSCDFVGFTPGDAITRITPPTIDNDLAFLLQRQAGLENVLLDRTAGTQMDVDTPVDLLILQIHPGIGAHTRAYLDGLQLDASRLRAAMPLVWDPAAEIIVAGRVGSHVLAHLETDLACRKRIISEERGMRASGREARGEVRSLLGFYVESVGPHRFFDSLAELGQAAFIDSRVIFHHLKLSPTAADRFHSDLLQPEPIESSFVREFTAAARDAPIPVLLGGHSLVSGGLWALIEAAWLEHDSLVAGRGG